MKNIKTALSILLILSFSLFLLSCGTKEEIHPIDDFFKKLDSNNVKVEIETIINGEQIKTKNEYNNNKIHSYSVYKDEFRESYTEYINGEENLYYKNENGKWGKESSKAYDDNYLIINLFKIFDESILSSENYASIDKNKYMIKNEVVKSIKDVKSVSFEFHQNSVTVIILDTDGRSVKMIFSDFGKIKFNIPNI